MQWNAEWIYMKKSNNDCCPIFKKNITLKKPVKDAVLYISALGVYEARLNDERIGNYVLAPGWTVYEKRVQYQAYNIKNQLKENNEIQILLGKGWFSSNMPGWKLSEDRKRRIARTNAIIAEIHITYEDGTKETIESNNSWECAESNVKFSEIYDGETYDANYKITKWNYASQLEWGKNILIPQEGEQILEKERILASKLIITPKGETVIDFGQEITGYIEFTVNAKGGEKIKILHGEVLDKDGNFYNANYRSAKAEINYICKAGLQTYHPKLTFFGFRYIKIEEFPEEITKDKFVGIAVYSNLKQTGFLQSGVKKVNQLFSNIFWSQKGNFLDVPTDCPQRDERLGWTGDAQVFVKAASYNFDIEKFFVKWLHDLADSQRENGSIGQVVPDYLPECPESAAWGDAATICPWQIYLTYGNVKILEDQFDSMKKWVDYISSVTTTPYLWTGGTHFGDWLALDTEQGSYKGATREDFIATAFYAYSTEILIKTAKVLHNDKDQYKYEKLYINILEAFEKYYTEYYTQTECVLAVRFHLTKDPRKTVEQLAEKIINAGNKIETGFVGTPYILHILSEYGYDELAYTLFLREKYPSWLYSVNKGATTVWEHWDGIMEDGDFWSTDMNSFNHYAYGSVIDWIYEKAAGICLLEEYPAFEKVKIRPMPDERLGWLEAKLITKNGLIYSRWDYENDRIRFSIKTDMPSEVIIDDQVHQLPAGQYTFWKER